jgi:hypothetical protein
MKSTKSNLSHEVRFARLLYRDLSQNALRALRELIQRTELSVISGEVLWVGSTWYVNHAGLLRLAQRHGCSGIHTQIIVKSSDPASSHWVFKATVFKTPKCKGFTGYGDADPSNVSSLVHGAEMRVAETRAVNRALRKAYGIGICSVEEIGSFAGCAQDERPVRKCPPESASGNGTGAHRNGSRVRDRLCQLIRQHKLDPDLVKAYAIDFCGTKTLREATREQIETFIAHLAEWATKDCNALCCQLNSYLRPGEGAA